METVHGVDHAVGEEQGLGQSGQADHQYGDEAATARRTDVPDQAARQIANQQRRQQVEEAVGSGRRQCPGGRSG